MKGFKFFFLIVVIIIVILLLVVFLHKPEDISKEKCEVVEVNLSEVTEPQETEITEEKIFRDQFGGITESRNEFYIIDYLSELKNNKILLKIMDFKSSELKKTISLKAGNCRAPNEFCKLIGRINYLNGRYFILNYKISIFDEYFKYQDCSVIRDRNFEYLQNLEYFQNSNKLNMFLIYSGSENERPFVTAHKIGFAVYELNPGSSIYGAKLIIDRIKNRTKYKLIIKEKGRTIFYVNYFLPKGFGFTIGEKLYYSVNTKQGFYVYDTVKKKKKFVKLTWLRPRIYSDEEALAVGTYKTLNLNDKKIVKEKGAKVFYKSGKTNKLYFLWFLKGAGNTATMITDLNTKENTFVANIIDISTGKLMERLILPYGQHFTRLLSEDWYETIPQFYIDYKRGIYIYGDRDDDWNELVRYCRFRIKK